MTERRKGTSPPRPRERRRVVTGRADTMPVTLVSEVCVREENVCGAGTALVQGPF